MSFKYLFLFFLLLPLSVSALTEEERKERDKVLNEYASEEARKAALNPDQDKSLLDQTKKTISEGYDSLKDKLPENVKNMLPGENTQPVKTQPLQVQAEKNTGDNSDDNSVDADLQAAQAGGEVLDPDAAIENANTASPMKMPKIDPAELAKLMKNLDGNPLLKMLSPQQREAAAKMMKQNPFASMKKDAIKNIILTKMDSKKSAGKFLHNNPKLVDGIAEWVIDDKAIPSFISIINKPDKAKIMGGIVIAVFITIFFLNLKNSKMNMLKRIFFKIGLMIASAVVNFTSFYIIYREELGPTVDVIARTM